MNDFKITSITKTDFTKGFSIWHDKWHIGDISSRSQGSLLSQEIFTHVKETGLGNTWRLRICRAGENSLKLNLWSARIDEVAPAIYRFACSNGDDEFNVGKALCLFSTDVDDWSESFRMEGANDVTVHCWIAMPKNFPGNGQPDTTAGNGIQTVSFRQTCISGVIGTYAELFKTAIGENADSCPPSDVTLAIIDQQTNEIQRQFFCHRFILMARSPMFATMFNGQWDEERDEPVKIKDVDEKTMESILRYIYIGELPNNDCDFDDVKNILYAAEKYILPQLKEWCSALFIMRFPNDRDRIDQIQLAERFGMDQLKAVCYMSLSTNIAVFQDQQLRQKLSDNSCVGRIDGSGWKEYGQYQRSVHRNASLMFQ